MLAVAGARTQAACFDRQAAEMHAKSGRLRWDGMGWDRMGCGCVFSDSGRIWRDIGMCVEDGAVCLWVLEVGRSGGREEGRKEGMSVCGVI